MVVLREVFFALAVIVALCAVFTPENTAVKPTFFAPLRTVAVFGTESAALLLERLTVKLEVGAALRYIEHAFDCAPVRDCVPHEI